MSPHKGPNIIKYCVITSTFSLVLITFSILPISKKAFKWNRCFNNVIESVRENGDNFEKFDLIKEKTLAVAICNGAFFNAIIK